MNWFKWFICWFNKKHVKMCFYDKEGKASRICVRCGYTVE